jgi:hypothetical protein
VSLRVLLVLFSIALVAGFAEAALRVVYGGVTPYFVSQIVRADDQRGWALVPGKYDFFNSAAFTRARMSINEFGIRSGSEPFQAAATRKRVTVFGDSFVFGEALSDGERFTEDLQRRVGQDCEVVNAGVPGYGTGQELLLLEELRAKQVDLGETVVLVVFTNDPSDNAGLAYESLERDPLKPVFEVRGEELIVTPPAPWPQLPTAQLIADINRKSLLFALVRTRAAIAVARFPWVVTLLARTGARVSVPRPPGVILTWYAPGWEDRWARTSDLIVHFDRVVKREGASLLVAFMPSPFQVEKIFEAVLRSHEEDELYGAFLADIDRPQRKLLELCEAARLRCIDLTPTLREPREGDAFFLQEGHLNALGSERVGRELFEVLSPDGC